MTKLKKKLSSAALAAILAVNGGGIHTPSAAAAAPIKIVINGAQLSTDQPAVMSGNRTMVPLRSVFEALNTKVAWKQSTKTVTASKNGVTITLPVGSKTATINGQSTTLDVPAKVIKGRTMVPLRFVTEALGNKVGWNKASQTVTITTNSTNSGNSNNGNTTPISTGTVTPVPYVSTLVVGQQGDGSDLQITFPASASSSGISQYRILVARAADAQSFNLAKALAVPAANYQSVPVGSSNYTITLQPQARDINGSLIQKNVSYRVYVVAVGSNGYASAVTVGQTLVNLGATVSATATPSNVRLSDVDDYGDGRDLSVAFDKPSDENQVAGYRLFIVRNANTNTFNVSVASGISSDNYTLVNKTGSNLTTRLKSSTRDTAGNLLKDGIPYSAFVMAVNSAGDALGLSAISNTITPGKSAAAPSITKVADVANNNNGSDLEVSFNKVSNESQISGYRIFVVRNSNYSDFDLATASSLASNRYMDVSKTGEDRKLTLSTSLRDNTGELVKNDVAYRVFVMSRGSGSYSDALSSASSSITLSSSSKVVGTTNNVVMTDVSDYGDGRDIQVTFNRATDENLISQYRVMITKSSNAGNLTLTKAQNMSSSNYTSVSKTGSNLTVKLAAGTRDTDGELIKNGVAYRAFVLSVGTGDASSTYALSSGSTAVTLAGSTAASAVNSLSVSNSSASSSAADITAKFTPANDTGIAEYRMIVVRSDQAGSFNLAAANNVSSANYTRVAKTASAVTQALTASTRDYNGNAIAQNTAYRVYVLTVADGSVRTVNALSSASNEFTITQKTAEPAVNVSADLIDNGSAIRVSFTRPSNSTGIKSYAIMLVPSNTSFTLSDANRLSVPNYQTVTNSTYNEWTFTTADVDINGQSIMKNISYKAFVLSVADGTNATVNALSTASREARIVNP